MATVAIVSNARPALQTRVVLRKTTLTEAWGWGVAAICLWTATWLVTEVLSVARDGLADQLWFASAVFVVSPFIAALGSRRPGSRVWSWFIVLPMTIVLGLPAVTAWNRAGEFASLRLEVPMLAGYGLVLLMGVGNYFGTRFSSCALLAAAAGLGVVLPMSSLGTWFPLDRAAAHAVSTILLSAAVWRGAHLARRRPQATATAFDDLWVDFRDLFGLVWARRVLDRINEAAVKDNWTVRLSLHGFVPADPAKRLESSALEAEQIEHSLRWLLRRFVDPEWIDERISRHP